MVVHTFNPSSLEAEAGWFLWVPGQPGLQGEFQDSQGYTEKPYLKQTNKQNQGIEHASDRKINAILGTLTSQIHRDRKNEGGAWTVVAHTFNPKTWESEAGGSL